MMLCHVKTKQLKLANAVFGRYAAYYATGKKKNDVVMSLDGTIIPVADLEQKIKQRRKKYFNTDHITGLGGNQIRAPWEQEWEETEMETMVDPTTKKPIVPATTPPILAQLSKMPSEYIKHPKTIGLIGVPFAWGQPKHGVDKGPTLIREVGLVNVCTKLGWRVNDHKDLSVVNPSEKELMDDMHFFAKTGALAHNASAVGRLNKLLYEKVKETAEKGEFVLTIGGDHSIGLGTVAGVLAVRPNAGVIWVDAHADINTPFTSESGNMHGMPLGLMMGDRKMTNSVPGFDWLNSIPPLASTKLVYIGCRDLDQAERRVIREKGIKIFTMHEVDRYGIGEIMERALQFLGNVPLHLSYDIDAVDPAEAPSTGTIGEGKKEMFAKVLTGYETVRGGFNYREANYICERIAESGRLCSMDLVEINPVLDRGEKNSVENTINLGLSLVASAMGQRIL